jgi:hypothetical protein
VLYHFFWQMPFHRCLNHHQVPYFFIFHACTGKKANWGTAKESKNNYYLLLEQCIIIFATLAFHAMRIYWTLFSPSLSLPFWLCVFPSKKVFKGIYDESCKAVVRKKFLYVLALQDANYGPQLIREIFHERFLGHLFPKKKQFLSLLCVRAKGKSSQA